jgi:hypothetical protein
MTDDFFNQLLSGIHGDEAERGPDVPTRMYKVTVTYYGGANIRRQPAIGNNIVRWARMGDAFLTPHAETTADGTRWIEIDEGFIATFYRTQRASVEDV